MKGYLVLWHFIISSVLSKGRSFTANSGAKAAVLLKGRSSIAYSGTWAAVLLGMDRCGSFPLLSAPHSLFSIWTDLKRSEKIPGAPTRRWEEWIWLTGSSGLHRNSPQGLNISSTRVFDQIRDPEIPITLCPLWPLNELILKIQFSEEGHLLARVRIKREKFYPAPVLEPGSLTLHANCLTNWTIHDKYGSTIELIS